MIRRFLHNYYSSVGGVVGVPPGGAVTIRALLAI
jgi:hypothetical protein